MVLPKTSLIILGFFLASASSLYIDIERQHPYYLIEDANILEDNYEDALYNREFESVQPSHVRLARQVGSVSSNPDGSMNINGKVPLIGNDKNVLSGIAYGSGLQNGKYGAAGAGLALDNVNGHGLSLTKTHIPAFGDQLTAAGKVNLLNTPNHNMNANAFITRNSPNIPNIPDFNTRGASVDYLYKNKVGGSFGVAQTPLFQKTDYSAMANLNLFRDRTSSLDLNAGATRSVSPFIPRSSWQPSAGLSFSKYF